MARPDTRGARTKGPRKTSSAMDAGGWDPFSGKRRPNASSFPLCVPFFSPTQPRDVLLEGCGFNFGCLPKTGAAPTTDGGGGPEGTVAPRRVRVERNEHKRRRGHPGSPPPVTHVYTVFVPDKKARIKIDTVRWKETDVVRERESDRKKKKDDGR